MTTHIPMTFGGVRQGVRMCLPYVPGYFVMGAVVGAYAAQKGLSFTEAVLMNALVCAASAQMVALQLWTEEWTWFHILAVAGVALMVNLRFVLSGASLRPWLAPVPAGFVYPVLGVLTDPAWAASIRYNSEGGRDFGFVAGASIFLWAMWVTASTPGYFIGSLITDPRAYGLDLFIAFTFAAILTPILARSRDFLPASVGAVAGVVASLALDGFWFIAIGAVSGAVAAAVAGPRR
ncbi:MAG: AzlC family ABC transporter permease [Beijerinckiaceae bacterium]